MQNKQNTQEIIYTHRTRSGQKARIVGTINSNRFPIVVAILKDDSEHEYCEQLTKDLMVLACGMQSDDDLFEYNHWQDVEVDTPILVKQSEYHDWEPRHFAKFQDGFVYAYAAGKTSWTASGDFAKWYFAKLPD